MATREFEVELSEPHLKNIYKGASPYQAIAELIWNSLDADANRVKLSFKRNALGGLEEIVISDDGHGIPNDEVEADFGLLGKSPKALKEKSPGNRFYHGKKGQGRYFAFALGSKVSWKSTSRFNDQLSQFTIQGDAVDNLKKFICVDASVSDTSLKNGVRVEITNLTQKTQSLEIEELRRELTAQFAFYIRAYGKNKINIEVDNEVLDTEAGIIADRTERFTIKKVLPGGRILEEDFEVAMFHWKDIGIRKRFLCGENGNVLLEDEKTGVRAKSFGHSVYVCGAYLDKQEEENTMGLFYGDYIYSELQDELEKRLKKFLRTVLADKAQSKLKHIKESKAYPYKEDPKTPLEEAKIQVFDIYLAEMLESPKNPLGSSTDIDMVILHLLKDAMEKNPKNIIKILQEILNLTDEDIMALAGLLEDYSLASIIKASRTVLDRLSFMSELEHILFDPEAKSIVLERSHLHKILENETWVFGDHFELGNSDQSLKNVLKTHLSHLGQDVKIADEVPLDGENKVLDIVLSKLFQRGERARDYLVIELKRPGSVLGRKELAQIEDYASYVSGDKRFDKDNCKWTFILIGNEIGKDILTRTQGIPRGKVIDGEKQNVKYDVWAIEWSQLLHEQHCKYQFIKEKLDQCDDRPENLEYLKKHYSEFLPRSLLDEVREE
ncbi:MAG: ATP-binding protein [Candidatus Gracilibacteria bacterium]